MPYSIEDRLDQVVARAWGTLSAEDIRELVEEFSRQPDRLRIPALVDLGEVDDHSPISSGLVREVAGARCWSLARASMAIVARADALFGMARMLENTLPMEAAAEDRLRVFRRRREAREFLESTRAEG
ncbi:MAG: hypothetical protein CL910_14725 [Deltaproteobacteria bacterium]|nr:hypothetical protein [Deltaproteobacteria bacterium]